MAADVFKARIAAQTDLIRKPDFDFRLKRFVTELLKIRQHLLVENELKKLKTLDSSYFLGKNYFEGNDGAQNALVFQTMQKYFKLINENQIDKWTSPKTVNSNFVFGDCLFGAIKITNTTNSDTDK